MQEIKIVFEVMECETQKILEKSQVKVDINPETILKSLEAEKNLLLKAGMRLEEINLKILSKRHIKEQIQASIHVAMQSVYGAIFDYIENQKEIDSVEASL